MAVLGLRFCARAFSSCGKQGPLFITVRGPLTIAASLAAEHRLQTCRLSSCGSRAQLLCGTWDLPRPGLGPVSPALAGRFSTTAPPGKPPLLLFKKNFIMFFIPSLFHYKFGNIYHIPILRVVTLNFLSWALSFLKSEISEYPYHPPKQCKDLRTPNTSELFDIVVEYFTSLWFSFYPTIQCCCCYFLVNVC